MSVGAARYHSPLPRSGVACVAAVSAADAKRKDFIVNTVSTYGPACFIANKPRSTKPRACRPVPPAPKLDARLPYRAYDFDALQFHVWSQGQTVRPDLERREPRAAEQPIAEMTLDELISTQKNEPLSESRRSFLSVGHGVLSLDAPSASSDEALGTIAETIADDHPLRAIAAIEDGLDPDELDDADHNALRYGVAYVTVDPITARQIEWEQDRARDGQTRITRITRSDEGKIGFASVGRYQWPTKEAFIATARRIRDTLFAEYGSPASYDELRARIDLVQDALESASPSQDVWLREVQRFPADEQARFLAPADPEWHSSYARPQLQAIVRTDDEGNERVIGRTRVTRLVHRRPLTDVNKDEFWHTSIPDVTAYELGTDGLVDPIVSDLGTY